MLKGNFSDVPHPHNISVNFLISCLLSFHIPLLFLTSLFHPRNLSRQSLSRRLITQSQPFPLPPPSSSPPSLHTHYLPSVPISFFLPVASKPLFFFLLFSFPLSFTSHSPHTSLFPYPTLPSFPPFLLQLPARTEILPTSQNFYLIPFRSFSFLTFQIFTPFLLIHPNFDRLPHRPLVFQSSRNLPFFFPISFPFLPSYLISSCLLYASAARQGGRGRRGRIRHGSGDGDSTGGFASSLTAFP